MENALPFYRTNAWLSITYERNDTNYTVGDIFLGTVKKVMPGLNAAFIDIGYQKDAFLHYHDLGVQIKVA